MENNYKDELENNKNKDSNFKENKKFVIIIFLLLILISIAYATLSSTLKISGTGGITGVRWDIHFENIVERSDKAEVVTPATIQGNTTNINYGVNLSTPGSYYEFETEIKNGGTIDAKLATTPTLSGITPEQDVYTNFTVTYSDGSQLLVGDVIKSGEARTIKVRVEIDPNTVGSQLPINDQTMNLTIDLNYIQAN